MHVTDFTKTYEVVILGIGAFASCVCRKLILCVRFGFMPIEGRVNRGDLLWIYSSVVVLFANPLLEFK